MPTPTMPSTIPAANNQTATPHIPAANATTATIPHHTTEPRMMGAEVTAVYQQDIIEHYCQVVRDDIDVYGAEKAEERWRVVCDYHDTEPWWHMVVRQVKPILRNALMQNRQWENHLREEGVKRQSATQNVQLVTSPEMNVQNLTTNQVNELHDNNQATISYGSEG